MIKALRKVFLPTALVAGLVGPSTAQTKDSEKMLDKTFQSSGGALKYLLFVPKGYSATGTKRYPLVVSLRGAGSTYLTATDNFEMAHPWIEDSVQAREPHFVMVPECIEGSWGGLAGAPSGGVMAKAAKAVVEAVEDLKKQYSLDTNRFVLTGFSLGGSGTYHIIELTPNYWAAAIPASAGGDTAKTEALAKTAIWHHQGSTDGTAGKRMAAGLDNHGYKVVRVVCDFTINNPAAWKTALQTAGGNAEAVAFKNAKAPVTVDSLRRAIDAGARYLYTELTGGNHEAGWMGAAHNPLLARWAFSKVRGGATVSLAPRAGKAWKRNGSVLAIGGLAPSEALAHGAFALTGRSLASQGAVGKAGLGSQVVFLRGVTP
jgi:poly(3-hydroxybutyrate) depolymerase